MKEFIKSTTGKTIIIIAIIAIVFIYITFRWYIEFSSFSVGLAKGILGFILVWALDKYGMKEIDTIEELKKGNIAYALFFLGLSIVIAAAILGS